MQESENGLLDPEVFLRDDYVNEFVTLDLLIQLYTNTDVSSSGKPMINEEQFLQKLKKCYAENEGKLVLTCAEKYHKKQGADFGNPFPLNSSSALDVASLDRLVMQINSTYESMIKDKNKRPPTRSVVLPTR